MEYLTLFGVALCLIAISYWRAMLRRREDVREELGREALRRRIAQDPYNLAAYEALGDSFKRAGRLEEASKSYAEALGRINVDTSDSRLSFQLQYKVRQIEDAIRERATRPTIIDNVLRSPAKSAEMVFCRDCGASNAPQAERCETCNSLLPIDTFGKAVDLTMRDITSRRGLVDGLVMIVVVIVILRIFAGLPGEVRGMLTISACLVAIFRLIWPGRS